MRRTVHVQGHEVSLVGAVLTVIAAARGIKTSEAMAAQAPQVAEVSAPVSAMLVDLGVMTEQEWAEEIVQEELKNLDGEWEEMQ